MARLIVALCVAACSGAGPRAVTPAVDGDFATTIPDAASWHALAARAGNERMAHVEVVKIIFDHEDNRLYFMQSRRWQIHYDFAARFLSVPGAEVLMHAKFNEHEYRDDDRRFVLGTVTHYLDQDVWAFELFAGDRLAIDATARVFAAIAGAVFFGDKLRYHPIPEAQVAALERVRAAMPVVTTEQLFADLKYQPLEIGEAWGYLRIVPVGAELPNDVHPYDIVVLGTQPAEIAPVAGIVTDELQAPLGHVAVLAHTRHTPNMALRHASLDPAFVALAGKPVHLRVGPNDYAIEAATPDDLAKAGRARRAKAPALQLDLRDPGMPKLAAIKSGELARFGAKTTQLARVARLKHIVTPRAFGLSFHAYAQFLAANALDREIAKLLGDPALRKDEAKLRAALEHLQAAIAAAPVPPAITDAVLARIHAELAGAATVRLRSSTNSEDLAGFSGAGLYRSAHVDPANRDDVERGLREVWASVWSYDAFAERDWYGIDHAKVAMAILVQESIDDDVVNGVAISGNPFFQGLPAVFINAQARGGSVTGAAGNEVPEQILVYTADTAQGVERISNSSRVDHHLLSDGEALALSQAMVAIHDEFVGDAIGSTKAVDVEFLVRTNRQLVIVQARPYTMSWSGDRSTPF